MSVAYECPLCRGSAWARADLARRTEAAVRAVANASVLMNRDGSIHLDVTPAQVAELRRCLDIIDGKAPEQLALIGTE